MFVIDPSTEIAETGGAQRCQGGPPVGLGFQCATDEHPEHICDGRGLADGGGKFVVQDRCFALVNRGEQLAAVGEMLVHQGSADTRSLCDGFHGDRVDGLVGEYRGGRRQQRVPPVHAAQARWPGRTGRDGLRNVSGQSCRVADHGDIMSPNPW